MDQKTLVEEQFKEGKLFLSQLDKEDLKVKAAFWFYDEAYAAWKLMIASSSKHLDVKNNVINSYRTITNVMRSIPEISLISSSDVIVIPLDHPLIKNFAPLINTGPNIVNLWFSNTLLNNIYVKGMLIYRMDVHTRL